MLKTVPVLQIAFWSGQTVLPLFSKKFKTPSFLLFPFVLTCIWFTCAPSYFSDCFASQSQRLSVCLISCVDLFLRMCWDWSGAAEQAVPWSCTTWWLRIREARVVGQRKKVPRMISEPGDSENEENSQSGHFWTRQASRRVANLWKHFAFLPATDDLSTPQACMALTFRVLDVDVESHAVGWLWVLR